MIDSKQLANNLNRVQAQVKHLCQEHHRSTNDVRLISVSKTWPLSQLQAAFAAGATDFGENYVQEAIDKFDQWQGPHPTWHFIGPLQSNKTRAIAERFDWVHSLDRLKIARRLNDQRPASLEPLKVFIQVNVSQDRAKAGIEASQVIDFTKTILSLPRLELVGLMTITAQGLDEILLSEQFKQLKRLQQSLTKVAPNCRFLSMGMTNDYPLAIACGATHIRVGRAIFGQRST